MVKFVDTVNKVTLYVDGDNESNVFHYKINNLHDRISEIETKYRVKDFNNLGRSLIFQDLFNNSKLEEESKLKVLSEKHIAFLDSINSHAEIENILCERNSLLSTLFINFSDVQNKEDVEEFNRLLKEVVQSRIEDSNNYLRELVSYISLLYLQFYDALIDYNENSSKFHTRVYNKDFLLNILNGIHKDRISHIGMLKPIQDINDFKPKEENFEFIFINDVKVYLPKNEQKFLQDAVAFIVKASGSKAIVRSNCYRIQTLYKIAKTFTNGNSLNTFSKLHELVKLDKYLSELEKYEKDFYGMLDFVLPLLWFGTKFYNSNVYAYHNTHRHPYDVIVTIETLQEIIKNFVDTNFSKYLVSEHATNEYITSLQQVLVATKYFDGDNKKYFDEVRFVNSVKTTIADLKGVARFIEYANIYNHSKYITVLFYAAVIDEYTSFLIDETKYKVSDSIEPIVSILNMMDHLFSNFTNDELPIYKLVIGII